MAGWNEKWETRRPDDLAIRAEGVPEDFEDQWGDITIGRVREIAHASPDLVGRLEELRYPTDYARCDTLGERYGLGAAEVAAVSSYYSIRKGEELQ